MKNKKTLSKTTIPFATTALVQQLVLLLESKGVLEAEEREQLFKDAADSQSSTDVADFLADMNAEIRAKMLN